MGVDATNTRKPVEVDVSTYEATRKQREEDVKNQKRNPYGKDVFLQLLIAQMKHQDPLEPMKNEEFLSQMAQLTATEQISNLAASFDKFQKSMTIMDKNGKEQNAIISELKAISESMKGMTGTGASPEFLKTVTDFMTKYQENSQKLIERIESLENEIKKLQI